MGRRISVRLSSMCGTPYIHQNVLIQLSSGEHWIPKSGPILMPGGDPKDNGGGTNSPKSSVRKIAIAPRDAVSASAKESGAKVSGVSGISTTIGTYKEIKGKSVKQGTAAVFEFSFDTSDDEVDFGMTGVKVTPKGKPRKICTTQLAMAIVVGKGTGEIEVKPVSPTAIIGRATSNKKRKRLPGRTTPKKKRKRLKSGEEGSYGDDRLYPTRQGNMRSAFWDPSAEQGAFWEWDGLNNEDWASVMQTGLPSPLFEQDSADDAISAESFANPEALDAISGQGATADVGSPEKPLTM